MKKMPRLAIVVLVLCGCGCSAQEVSDDPLHRYLEGNAEEAQPPRAAVAATPRSAAPSDKADESSPATVTEPPPRPFFEAYLGEHRYDVTKEILFPIKGGEVAYRFRRVDSATAYPPHDSYYEFEFHVQASGPGLLFMDEARFVAHCTYDGEKLLPRRFRVGLADGSYRHFATYDLDPETRALTVTDELARSKTEVALRSDDPVDPVTFFFNLFCLGVDMSKVESLHGHLLHPNESPILVSIDKESGTAEVGFAAGEFLPNKRSRFRFFFDEEGRIDIDRFELEYGSWSMSMKRTSGPDLERR